MGSLAGVNYAVTITDTNGCSIVIDTFIYELDTLLITNIGVTSDYNGFGVSCIGASMDQLLFRQQEAHKDINMIGTCIRYI